MTDATDRRLINLLHGGFPIVDRPYADVGRRLGLEEAEVIDRLAALLLLLQLLIHTLGLKL